MRGRSNSEHLQGASKGGAKGRPTIDAQTDRLIAQIEDIVPLKSFRWREPLRVLLTHPRPPSGLSELHKYLRAACRRTHSDEKFVDQLVHAVVAAERAHGLSEFLAPIQFVLTACMGAISQRPRESMLAARQIIATAGLPKPMPLSFAIDVYDHAPLSLSKIEATETVEKVAQAAVGALLREQTLGQSAFASWRSADILAGMEALWLAYTYCGHGTANAGKLCPEERRLDWERCGAALWRRLDRAGRLAHPVTSREPYVDKTPEFCRLALALNSAMPSSAHFGGTIAVLPVDRSTHIVCRTAIPDSSDKHDKEEIARHRVLETPLAVAPMPPLHFIERSKTQLLTEFPWAKAVIDVIFDDLFGRANLGAGDLTLPPTLLVGSPGAGKSRLVRRLADMLDLARLDVSLSGTSDTKIIGGTSRGWAGGRPSDLASLLARRNTASAMVLLDEIDKASDSHRDGGGVCAYLLALLEPETASRHYDNFLKTECDFSKVSWLCTANVLSAIPKPLLSRLRILVVPQPQPQHFPALSRGVIAELEQRWHLPVGTLPPAGDLHINWERLKTARQVRVATEASLGHWARTVIRH